MWPRAPTAVGNGMAGRPSRIRDAMRRHMNLHIRSPLPWGQAGEARTSRPHHPHIPAFQESPRHMARDTNTEIQNTAAMPTPPPRTPERRYSGPPTLPELQEIYDVIPNIPADHLFSDLPRHFQNFPPSEFVGTSPCRKAAPPST